jgi:hypothetical protein
MEGSPERRRSSRIPVQVPINGQILPVNVPAILRDINADGLAVRTTVNLTPGTVYRFAFFANTTPVVVSARLVHSMRAVGPGDEVWYVAGFTFADWSAERDAIAALVDRVVTLNVEGERPPPGGRRGGAPRVKKP